MARRFIYLVLTILVLQLSWSTVAEYCEHETGRAAQHFGHHSSLVGSAQESFTANDPPAKAKAADSLHSHCSSCTHTPLSFEGLPGAILVLESARFAPFLASFQFSSSYVAPPERPQWIAAV
jgi:hypothetical protein